ncbi:hypothetical protein QFC21_002240 [Naganishia friedmannii]|uniref:Uncharacterized protein n=1 Tax=Naganishia friedmannii TaxID=89922 RepID=A0ACC2VWH6_9TREE|nr:hypothetical protein QFC21_002240 [Naganishia friedmannii]
MASSSAAPASTGIIPSPKVLWLEFIRNMWDRDEYVRIAEKVDLRLPTGSPQPAEDEIDQLGLVKIVLECAIEIPHFNLLGVPSEHAAAIMKNVIKWVWCDPGAPAAAKAYRGRLAALIGILSGPFIDAIKTADNKWAHFPDAKPGSCEYLGSHLLDAFYPTWNADVPEAERVGLVGMVDPVALPGAVPPGLNATDQAIFELYEFSEDDDSEASFEPQETDYTAGSRLGITGLQLDKTVSTSNPIAGGQAVHHPGRVIDSIAVSTFQSHSPTHMSANEPEVGKDKALADVHVEGKDRESGRESRRSSWVGSEKSNADTTDGNATRSESTEAHKPSLLGTNASF